MSSLAKELNSNGLTLSGTEHKKKRSIYHIGKFRHQIGRTFTIPEIEALADEVLEWMESDKEELWLKSFFLYRHISPSTIKSLALRSAYFAECYELAFAMQEERLFRQGMKSTNATVIFALKACHRWKDLPEPDPQDTSFDLIDGWTGSEPSTHTNKP
ncbi:MAG: hypothetical protein Q8M92_11015 [Candidatus Subteraquimicrobiales bacterium]|nr:hypothetical protein [Candidatus Subteraquimicrobiales bacterium]